MSNSSRLNCLIKVNVAHERREYGRRTNFAKKAPGAAPEIRAG
jgi:hypothetical protein